MHNVFTLLCYTVAELISIIIIIKKSWIVSWVLVINLSACARHWMVRTEDNCKSASPTTPILLTRLFCCCTCREHTRYNNGHREAMTGHHVTSKVTDTLFRHTRTRTNSHSTLQTRQNTQGIYQSNTIASTIQSKTSRKMQGIEQHEFY